MSNANSQFTPFGAGELNIRILDVDAPAAVSISAAFKWKDKQWKKQTTDRPASSEEKQHFSIILWRNKSTNLSSNYIPYTCFITILVETQQKYRGDDYRRLHVALHSNGRDRTPPLEIQWH